MKMKVAGCAGRGGKLVGALVGAIIMAAWFVPSSGAGAPPRQVFTEVDGAERQARVDELDIKLEDVRSRMVTNDAVQGGGPVGPTEASRGGIVFDNMPGDDYAAGGGWTINVGAPIGKNWDQGPGFSPSATGTLTDVWLAVVLTSGVNELDVWLMSDVGGLPGAIIHSMHFSGQMGSFFADPLPPPLHWNGVGPTIFAGTQYYLVASASGPDMQGAFRTNTIGDIGPRAKRVNLGAWGVTNETRGAIRIGIGGDDPCGDPDAGDCCVANGIPGCSDPSCCADVCGIDPFCCESGYDEACVALACDQCGCPAEVCDPCGDGFCDPETETFCNCEDDCDPACGDGCCTIGENRCNCRVDCSSPCCGDGVCEGSENNSSCPTDCPSECGNGECAGGETACDCPIDCDPLPDDGCCTGSENPCSSPNDECPSVCGDGCCSGDENKCGCPQDCSFPCCGDSACEGDENPGNCPADCPTTCGDGFCVVSETPELCLADCPTTCGDGFCVGGESLGDCPEDCALPCAVGGASLVGDAVASSLHFWFHGSSTNLWNTPLGSGANATVASGSTEFDGNFFAGPTPDSFAGFELNVEGSEIILDIAPGGDVAFGGVVPDFTLTLTGLDWPLFERTLVEMIPIEEGLPLSVSFTEDSVTWSLDAPASNYLATAPGVTSLRNRYSIGAAIGCDDGVFCNGIEQCVAPNECAFGPPPCGGSSTCLEESSSCIISLALTGTCGEIGNIIEFLDECPTEDPAYDRIRADFVIRRNGVVVGDIPCTEPISAMDVSQYTDELIILQGLRVLYYMDRGRTDHVPWTAGTIYDWMASQLGGFEIREDDGPRCCATFDSERYVIMRVQDDFNRDYDRMWEGMSGQVALFVHEARHLETGGHQSCCEVGRFACDQTYDESDLLPYGTQAWLHKSWLSGHLDIGLACLDPTDRDRLARRHLNSANAYARRFCDDLPPEVIMPDAPGGSCCVTPAPSATLADILWSDTSFWSFDLIPNNSFNNYNVDLFIGSLTGGLIGDSVQSTLAFWYNDPGTNLWAEPFGPGSKAIVSFSDREFEGVFFSGVSPKGVNGFFVDINATEIILDIAPTTDSLRPDTVSDFTLELLDLDLPGGITGVTAVQEDLPLDVSFTSNSVTLILDRGAPSFQIGTPPGGALVRNRYTLQSSSTGASGAWNGDVANRGGGTDGLRVTLDLDVALDELRVFDCVTLDISGGDMKIETQSGIIVGGIIDVELDRKLESSGPIAFKGVSVGVATGGCLVSTLNNSGEVEAASMEIADAGQFLVKDGATTTLQGALILKGRGTYQAKPSQDEPSSASLVAESVLITTDEAGDGGKLSLTGSMSVLTLGDLELSAAGGCAACKPPEMSLMDSTSADIEGSLIMSNGSRITVATQSFTLKGDFDNHITDPSAFDWTLGAITLEGDGKVFRVAGEDHGTSLSGFENNFAMGRVEVAPGAKVTFANQSVNAAAGGAKALYVGALSFEAGSQITVDAVRVYYQSLGKAGARVVFKNGGQLIQTDCLGSVGCDDGNLCTFDQCVDGTCLNTDVVYGDIAGGGGTCGPNGTVELSDILAVLNGFSGTFSEGCEFVNIDIAGQEGSCTPNQSIDLFDIFAVLNAFQGIDNCCSGPRGACCRAGACTDGVAVDHCGATGGEYRGDGTLCDETQCSAIGACCAQGTCIDILDESGCTILAGVYLGDGTVCSISACESIDQEFEAECGLAIPDNDPTGGARCELIVPFDGTVVNDVNAAMFIRHTWQGDLRVVLSHEETGTSVTLIDRVGVASCGTQFGYSANDFGSADEPLVLDDEASTPIDPYNTCAMDGTDGYAGPAIPENPLSAFDGESKGGTWTLTVFDIIELDVGVLENFSLRFPNQSARGTSGRKDRRR